MTESDIIRVARQVADLRLQLDALQTVAKASSLPETLNATRKTIKISALIIACALLISSVVRAWDDRTIRALEDRIGKLEAKGASPTLTTPTSAR